MTTATRRFHIGSVLSITDGSLVDLDHITGVAELVDFMLGRPHMTHELPSAADHVAPSLRRQFPALAAVKVPHLQGVDEVEAFLATLYPEHGRFVNVTSIVGLRTPAIEYRAVLLCRDDSRCVKTYPDTDRRHVLDRTTGQPYTSRQDAVDHANAMRRKVWGTEHDVLIETRQVTAWAAES